MPAALDHPDQASEARAATGLVPLMRYRDVAAAAEWLCRAFGFERHAEVPDDTGGLIYAQLKCGSALVMLVPVGRSDLDALMCQPDEAGGLETQACYVVVPDIATHIAAAKAAGAEILLGLAEDGTAPAGYTCRDPEGHVWSFGVYDPAVAGTDATARKQSAAMTAGSERRNRRPSRAAIAAALSIALLGSAAVLGTSEKLTSLASQWVGLESATAANAPRDSVLAPAAASGEAFDALGSHASLQDALETERAARAEAERTAALAREAATAAETRRIEAVEAQARAANELAVERRIREAAERAHHELVVELEKEKGARAAAEQSLAATGRAAGSEAAAAPPGGASVSSAPVASSTPEAKATQAVQKSPAETGSVGPGETNNPEAKAEKPKVKKTVKAVRKTSGQTNKAVKKPPKTGAADSPWTAGPF